MFTDKGQAIIDLAKDYAFSLGTPELDLTAVIVAMGKQAEAAVLLAQAVGLSSEALRAACPTYPEPVASYGKMTLAASTRTMLICAKDLAAESPDRVRPGLVDVRHLACGMAMSPEVCSILKVNPRAHEEISVLLASWYQADVQAPRIENLMDRLGKLRSELMQRIFGQDHAVHAFVEGLFNAEIVAVADTARKSPRALFVFAGPPGVGKTYLAELGASYLDRPFKRFDMSAYSGHYQSEALVGMGRSYVNAHAGQLTEYVEKNPDAVLLFDEIEKAHINTIHLFLQVLDAGTLEDKYHERNVSFRDTTIIFTTNASRMLYDQPNMSGVHRANAEFHRKTILDALQNEKDPETRQPFFPPAICSRMAAGYPVLFNHLGVNELERVARSELVRIAGLLERQYYKQVTFDDIVPMCLVLREGSRADARTLRSQTEMFVKTEVFKFCQLFDTTRLEDAFQNVDRLHLSLERNVHGLPMEVRALFEPQEKPKILMVADAELANLYCGSISDVNWRSASTCDEALEILASEEVDLILLDIWIGRTMDSGSATVMHFDHVPIASRGLGQGQELLRTLHERLPDTPVYLLSLTDSDAGNDQGSVDDTLFMACVRAGGARGLVVSSFVDATVDGWQTSRDRCAASLTDVAQRLYREKQAARMGQERKVLTFDTAPRLKRAAREVVIRMRNFRLTRAIGAQDVGEILQDVERPATRFDDVIGANAAKEELQFFCDFLRNPRGFAALGLRPPKGVLLHGPPGTGKTMLARAMAGESNVAFISASASNFVTIWQGSGPQSIRDLFGRARRYAPSIIFIDEIDAIGKVRAGSPGAGQAEELTLNSLLAEMDGFAGGPSLRPVFVLAATNFNIDAQNPDAPERSARTLDPALVRRFDRTILVDLPDRAGRALYLTRRLEGRKGCRVTEATIDQVAKQTPGLSIANLEHIIETAARAAAKKEGVLTADLLEEALQAARYGEVKAWDSSLLESTARHEAGHTVMYWLSGWCPVYVTVVARGSHGGFMQPAPEEAERGNFTRDELFARVRTSLGGRAAEIVFYGPTQGLTTGASQDLEHATRLVRRTICEFGMDDEIGLISLSQEEATTGPMAPMVHAAIAKSLKREMACTIETLTTHRDYVEALAKALVEKNRLTADDVRQILAPLKQGFTSGAT